MPKDTNSNLESEKYEVKMGIIDKVLNKLNIFSSKQRDLVIKVGNDIISMAKKAITSGSSNVKLISALTKFGESIENYLTMKMNAEAKVTGKNKSEDEQKLKTYKEAHKSENTGWYALGTIGKYDINYLTKGYTNMFYNAEAIARLTMYNIKEKFFPSQLFRNVSSYIVALETLCYLHPENPNYKNAKIKPDEKDKSKYIKYILKLREKLASKLSDTIKKSNYNNVRENMINTCEEFKKTIENEIATKFGKK